MDSVLLLTWILMGAFLQPINTQKSELDAVLNCCEGDLLFLLDSSGSVSSYEYSRMLSFLSELLSPFSLGANQVRVALLQVGTEPRLEFGFDTYTSQQGLQEALKVAKQVRGDTNTEAALKMAQQVLRPGAAGGVRAELPRVLLWLTDGLQPGPVEGLMAALRQEGVAVLAVSTGHSNYRVLQQVVTPPTDSHLYFVDIDDMSIITKDLRDAIIEIIRAQRLHVRDVTTSSASLHWRPVLSGGTGFYNIQVDPVIPGEVGEGDGGRDGELGTSSSTGGPQHQRLTRPADANQAELRHLLPGATYKVTLTTQPNVAAMEPLTATFTTLSVSPDQEVLSPTVVTVSNPGMRSVRVSWGPLQPESVKLYVVEYSALPQGKVRATTVTRDHNSTLLTQLQPDTQYLVTVSALHSSGQERAMSVKVCTQEELLPLADLQLTPAGHDSVQVQWKGSVEGLQGYWVTWQGAGGNVSSSRFLPQGTLSTLLTDLPAGGARVCVSPVYRTARGEGLCCTARFHPGPSPWTYSPHSLAQSHA
ncbi:von Willebrand factor A domain-containing protein 1 [Brienomyrus brachyistius]|uniref:von Willebrand factor A domain-containing protein 1 n=1 Tax=Brienomyrus brachyistius TaxID=42636 RepID=UPI0020B2067E|nr:von Willebrand factor A domain-containing protein 1 [Brienomyrus brachyistius]